MQGLHRCIRRRTVEVGPGVSEDLCEFMRSCGGYHKRDRRKRNTPKRVKIVRMVSIVFDLRIL